MSEVLDTIGKWYEYATLAHSIEHPYDFLPRALAAMRERLANRCLIHFASDLWCHSVKAANAMLMTIVIAAAIHISDRRPRIS